MLLAEKQNKHEPANKERAGSQNRLQSSKVKEGVKQWQTM